MWRRRSGFQLFRRCDIGHIGRGSIGVVRRASIGVRTVGLNLGCVAGERQEHVIERWVADAEVLERDTISLQALTGRYEHLCGALGGHAHRAPIGIDAGYALPEIGDQHRCSIEL